MTTRTHEGHAAAGIGIGVELETAPRERHHKGHEPKPEHGRYARRNDEFIGAGVFPASGNLLLVPQPFGPPQGFIWHVMGYQVAGAGGVATLVGQADIYVGPLPGSATAGDVGAYWKDTSRYNQATAQQLPLSGWFVPWQLVITAGQGIYAIVSGGVASTTAYTFTGDVLVEPDPASHTDRANLL